MNFDQTFNVITGAVIIYLITICLFLLGITGTIMAVCLKYLGMI